MPRNDFKRAQERYEGGELVVIIDGSGGMPFAFGSEPNLPDPFVIAVEYAIEAKALSASPVSGYVFGETEGPFRLPLDKIKDPMHHFPHGSSYFMPAFDEVIKTYEAGKIKKPAHFVVVSDGDISEAFNREEADETITKLAGFLRNHPEVMLDIIIPNVRDGQSPFVELLKRIGREAEENPPRVFEVKSAANLKKAIASVINERTNAVENFENAARAGAEQPVTVMRTLSFRKPTEPV